MAIVMDLYSSLERQSEGVTES